MQTTSAGTGKGQEKNKKKVAGLIMQNSRILRFECEIEVCPAGLGALTTKGPAAIKKMISLSCARPCTCITPICIYYFSSLLQMAHWSEMET